MKYNIIEPLHFFLYEEVLTFIHQAEELFPLKCHQEKARLAALNLYRKDGTSQSSYLISYDHDCLLFLSFKQEIDVAIVTDCLYCPNHAHANVSLASWLTRLDGIFRYFNIERYQLLLKTSILDVAELFESVMIDADGMTVIRCVSSTKTAVVLGGGGARGAYQLGVWQYFNERNLTYDIVTGASVGALNGALMVQDDLKKAQLMWHHIETTDVFDISTLPSGNMMHFSTLLEGMGAMAVEAMLNQGISTEPLHEYIKHLLNHERLSNDKPSLWLTATHLLTMEEKVIHLNSCEPGRRVDWLLASASFFPALRPCQIDGEYYVDGGYRNNIPVDIAVKEGGNQLFIIDVKGPGITKKYNLPLDITPVVLKSPWLLGNMLLFDTQRAKWNQQLGYLEIKKQVENKAGFWYTFDIEIMSEEYLRMNRLLVSKLKALVPVERLSNKKMTIVYEQLRMVYMSKVSAYNLGWVILELTGKLYGLEPTTYYSVEAFCHALSEHVSQAGLDYSPTNLSSLSEWLAYYRQEKYPLSEKSQVARWLARFRQGNWQKQWLDIGMFVQPDTFLIACLVAGLQS